MPRPGREAAEAKRKRTLPWRPSGALRKGPEAIYDTMQYGRAMTTKAHRILGGLNLLEKLIIFRKGNTEATEAARRLGTQRWGWDVLESMPGSALRGSQRSVKLDPWPPRSS